MTTTTDPDFGAREALRLLGPDPENWVPERPGIDHNVTIVGGSGSGSTFAFALRRVGIGRVTVIDAAEDENHAGVWLTRARMNKLRTPKNLAGHELGIPELSFQAWYESRHGAEAYAAIDRIPRLLWAEYLSWYRRFLGIQVRYQTKLVRVEPAEGFFRLHLEVNGTIIFTTETQRTQREEMNHARHKGHKERIIKTSIWCRNLKPLTSVISAPLW